MPNDDASQSSATTAIERQPSPRAAYIHVPFCAHRCGYCNFTLVAGRSDLIPAYLGALESELSKLSGVHEVDTLFFGGGTPTQLSANELERLFDIVRRKFPLAAGGELSVEANPADFTFDKARAMQSAGVSRISLGAQSFQPQTLKLLERDHAPADIASAVELARTFARSVSLDLIFACPGQTLPDWERELAAGLALQPDHLSTYGLTYERGTSFWSRLQQARLAELDDETQRTMYLKAIDTLTAAGFEHYEVSNHARPGHRCRHNEVYWRGAEYLAAGPGAARYVDGERSVNHRSTFTWLKRIGAGQSAIAERERLDPEDKARELLVLGLRRTAGINVDAFRDQSGFDPLVLLAGLLDRWRQLDLIEQSGSRLRLTREGLLLSDQMWSDVVRV